MTKKFQPHIHLPIRNIQKLACVVEEDLCVVGEVSARLQDAIPRSAGGADGVGNSQGYGSE